MLGACKVWLLILLIFGSTTQHAISSCDETLSGTNDEDYRGCQTMTRSCRTCQKWSKLSPHQHTNTPYHLKGQGTGVGNHNKCRNPDGSETIWCYTTDSSTRYEFCDPLAETLGKTATDVQTVAE